MAVRTLEDYIAGRSLAELEEAGDPIARRLSENMGVLYFTCRCGRVVLPHSMVDLEPPEVPAEIRTPRSVRAWAIRQRSTEDDRRFACGGCRLTWLRTGLITRDGLRAATGAPPLPAGSPAHW